MRCSPEDRQQRIRDVSLVCEDVETIAEKDTLVCHSGTSAVRVRRSPGFGQTPGLSRNGLASNTTSNAQTQPLNPHDGDRAPDHRDHFAVRERGVRERSGENKGLHPERCCLRAIACVQDRVFPVIERRTFADLQ